MMGTIDNYNEKPLNTIYFASQSHSDTLLIGLNLLRSKSQLLDVTLFAEGQSFQAHRVVLASCSDYFRAMFTDAMLESKQREIKLNGVTAKGIKLLLDYAYTSELSLNLANIQDVLSAASHVQLLGVVDACSNYLQSQLDLDNCVDIVTIAETYSLNQLRNSVYGFISGHLKEFSLSKEFFRLSAQQLEYLLKCDFPVDCAEVEILKIVVWWLQHHNKIGQTKRLSYSSRFLKNLQYKELKQWDINKVLQGMFESSNESDLDLYNHMWCDICQHFRKICMVPSMRHNLINSRGMELAILKVGGFSTEGITNEITFCLPGNGKWKRLTKIPHVEQCNFGAAVQNNELYVVGGCFNQSLQENIHPFGFRYSPRYDKWMTMEPMHKNRCRFSLNVVGRYLYAVGGSSDSETDQDGESGALEDFDSVECYDPSTDSWKTLLSLPESRAQHAGCGWPLNNPNRLIISGGLHGEVVLKSVMCYIPEFDCWEELSPLITPRADHVMLTINNKIYVCGGWYEENGNRVLSLTIDCFDFESNLWNIVTTIPTPRYHAGVVCVGTKLYIIGGFHSDAMFDRATSIIECYDFESNLWSKEENYPQEVWEHTCVSLFIPKYKNEMDSLTVGRDAVFVSKTS